MPALLRKAHYTNDKAVMQADRLSGFMFAVKELDLLQLEFNEVLWHTTIEQVTVYGNGRMVWRFGKS